MTEMQDKLIKEAVAAFKMPRVDIGDPILWHSSGQFGDGSPIPATVLKCGERNIEIQVAVPNVGLRVYSGVFHADDPKTNMAHKRDVGVWSKSPQMIRIDILEHQLKEMSAEASADLVRRVAALERAG